VLLFQASQKPEKLFKYLYLNDLPSHLIIEKSDGMEVAAYQA
jgi:hypothetical protein